MDHSVSLVELSEACTHLANELVLALKKERDHLVQFDTEALLENNLEKEQKLKRLKLLREELKSRLSGDGSPEAGYQNALEAWVTAWTALKNEAEFNQRFMKHSLRNMDLLTENLHRLFGLHTLYTQKGTRTEVKTSGKVVEGRY